MTLQYELDRYVKDHQDEWYKEGEQSGEAKAQANLVCSMYANGISIEQISIIAKISIGEVKEILSAHNKIETN